MQPSCTEPNQLDTKGKREEEKREGKGGEKGGKKEGKREEKRGFLQKNRILQIFVGII